jgi:hypothetical protein
MDEDAVTALVYAHLMETLRLAVNAATLVELPTVITLRRLRELQQVVEDLEVSTVMLLNRTGVSWERMATELGVTRQSLNRRLSRKVVQLEGSPHNLNGLEAAWRGLLPSLRAGVDEVLGLEPHQIARGRARRMLSGTEIPEALN